MTCSTTSATPSTVVDVSATSHDTSCNGYTQAGEVARTGPNRPSNRYQHRVQNKEQEQRRKLASQVQAALREKNFANIQAILEGATSCSSMDPCNDEKATTASQSFTSSSSAADILWCPIRGGSYTTCMHLAAKSMLNEQYCSGDHDSGNNHHRGDGAIMNGGGASIRATAAIDDSMRQHRTQQQPQVMDWWRWILEQASGGPDTKNSNDSPLSSTPSVFFTARDKSGETIFDIFFSTWLHPPRGASRAFRNFESSLEIVLASRRHMNSIRHWIQYVLHRREHNDDEYCSDTDTNNDSRSTEGEASSCRPAYHHHFRNKHNLPSNPHEQIVARFYRALELLCRYASRSDGASGEDRRHRRRYQPFSILHVLAQLPSCHVGITIGRFIVEIFPEHARIEPLPLHLWVAAGHNPNEVENETGGSSNNNKIAEHNRSYRNHQVDSYNSSTYDCDGGLLIPLLRAYPDAAGRKIHNDHSSRRGGYPLHVALYYGKQPLRQTVQAFINAYPPVLNVLVDHHYHNSSSALTTTSSSYTSTTHALASTTSTSSSNQLPTWALVALAAKHETRSHARKRLKRQPDETLYDWLDSNLRVEQDQYELDCIHLTTIYQVVRALPQALFLQKINKDA